MLPSAASNVLKTAYVIVTLFAIYQLAVTLILSSHRLSSRVPVTLLTNSPCGSSNDDTDHITLPTPPNPAVTAIFVFNGDKRAIREALRCFVMFANGTRSEVIIIASAERSSDINILRKSISGHRIAVVDSVKFLSSAYTTAVSLASPNATYFAFFGFGAVISSLDPLLALMSTLEGHLAIGAGCTVTPPQEPLPDDDEVMRGCFPSVRDSRTELCDGSLMVIRRHLYDLAGGFNSRSYPHYGLVADLQLRLLTTHNMSVYTLPQINIRPSRTPLEMTDARRCFAARRAFDRKWSGNHLMKSYTAPTVSPMRLRILFIDQAIPDASIGSGFGRALQIQLTIATLGHFLTVYPILDTVLSLSAVTELSARGIEVVDHSGIVQKDWPKRLDVLATFLTVRSGFYDVVVVSRPPLFMYVHKVLKRVAPKAYLIYDAEALWYQRDVAKALSEHNNVTLAKAMMESKKELALFWSCDQAWLVSNTEKAIAATAGSNASLQEIVTAETLVPPQLGFQDRYTISFLGAFHGSLYYNGDAIIWFIRNVWPIIRKQIDYAPLFIGGSEPPVELTSRHSPYEDQIYIRGHVTDLNSFHDVARVFVTPHQYGAGIQIKLLGALAHGVPCVVLRAHAAALALRNHTDGVLIANSALEMASLVVAVYTNETLWETLHQNGVAYVTNHHSPEQLRSAVAAALSLVSKSRAILTSN